MLTAPVPWPRRLETDIQDDGAARGAWPTGLKSNTLPNGPYLFTWTGSRLLEGLGGRGYRHSDRVWHIDVLRAGGHVDGDGLARLTVPPAAGCCR